MVGAGKKADGRDGHKQVPATRPLPRDERRGRIEGPKQAAGEGPKGTNRADVAAETNGRVLLQQRLKTAALNEVHRAIHVTKRMLAPLGWRTAGSWRPAADQLSRPGVQVLLIVIAATAGFSTAARIGAAKFDRDGILAAVVAVTALLLAALPYLLGTPALRLGHVVRGFADAVRLRWPASMSVAPRRVVAIALLVGLAACGAWLRWGRGPPATSLASLSGVSGKVVEGRVTAISGDTVRVGGRKVRLAGIEAPEREQLCSRPGNQRWRCGEAATEALSRSLRRTSVRCEIRDSDGAGSAVGTCYAQGKDIAARLVREGHVFSSGGWFASYSSLERQARTRRTGLWQGEAERPAEYRAKVWEAAKRTAPGGCPIKGQVSAGSKIYVLPWSPGYQRIQVRAARGERWFCSEREAQAAGWKPAERG
jgi:endonuclease YncB( thermonuclease family)